MTVTNGGWGTTHPFGVIKVLSWADYIIDIYGDCLSFRTYHALAAAVRGSPPGAGDAEFWMVMVALDKSAARQDVGHDVVLAIWQELVGRELSPPSVQRFQGHPDLPALGRFSEDRLRTAGSGLYQRSGRLLLAEWVRECTWDGGGSAFLTWEPLAAGDPDAAIVARDLLAAAVGSLPRERDRTVLAQRLGAGGHGAMTLEEIGHGLQLPAERVRQIQSSAIDQLCQPHTPARGSHYVGRLISGLLEDAADDGVEPAAALVTLAEAACPGVPAMLAVLVLARLAGFSKYATVHLSAEVSSHYAVPQPAGAQRARSAVLAAERLARMLPRTEWPGGRKLAPPRHAIRPQRHADADGAGTWQSVKLEREVGYDSVAELSFIRMLDRAPQVLWFCEQPVAIGYSFDGRHRTYYPDLLMATGDGYCVLVEVKPLPDMPLAVNQAKAAAARQFCARHGWGYLLTDAGGQTLHDLLALPVPEPAAQAFAEALHAAGTMTWRDVKASRERHQLASLQVSALALQRGWEIRLAPYRITDANGLVA